MSDAIFNARFIGRKSVEGPLHDRALSLIVSELNSKARDGGDTPCHLEWTDRSLLVHYIKKDEGFFESDGESVRSSDDKSPSEGEDSDTSSANSSGTDSSDENAASRTSPTRRTFDHKESYPLSDVLICHADKDYRKCVIWIVRKGPELEALVFMCPSEERVRDLYREYQEGHRRSKLERQRAARIKVGKRLTGSAESILEERNSLKTTPSASSVHHRHSANADTLRKWNLIHHTDSDGVTHIEVESSSPASKPDKSKFTRELESILSKEMKFRSPKEGKLTSSQKAEANNLSLRQRAPALLLKKFDEIEEKVYSSWASKSEEDHNRKVWSKGPSAKPPKRPDASKQILVPTKTGSEPVKKLYPKDQAPSNDRLLRNVPARYLAISPNNIQFASSTQPHSLPTMYHMGHVAWASRYPATIIDYPPESLWSTSVPRSTPSSLIGGAHHRGRSRDRVSRESFSESNRRRAQSKSPARSEGNISRVFREFGDAVKSRMSRKSSTNSVSFPDVTHLKSNLKKPPDSSSSPLSLDSNSFKSSPLSLLDEVLGSSTHLGGGSDKKVHFNKFATVQMME